jgi:protein phosphatase
MLTGIGASVAGQVRNLNQDRLFIDDERRLWIVADGMGGHSAGEVAADMAVKLLPEFIQQGLSVVDALCLVHDRMYQLSSHNPDLSGMGTTIVVARVIEEDLGATNKNNMELYWIGDCRAYLVHMDGITRLTKDHSHVGELIEQGLLSESAARNHPKRHWVTQCIGGANQQKPKIGMASVMLGSKQTLLLCSDGLHDELSDHGIFSCMESSKNSQSALDELVKQAMQAGGRDNISAILIHAAANTSNDNIKTADLNDHAKTGLSRRFGAWLTQK